MVVCDRMHLAKFKRERENWLKKLNNLLKTKIKENDEDRRTSCFSQLSIIWHKSINKSGAHLNANLRVCRMPPPSRKKGLSVHFLFVVKKLFFLKRKTHFDA